MKKGILFSFFIFSIITASSGQNDPYRQSLLTDSAYIFNRVKETSAWNLTRKVFYFYSSGKLTEYITNDAHTNTELLKTVYEYNESGYAHHITNLRFSASWIPDSRSVTDYDLSGRINSIRIQKWINDTWTEDRLQYNYSYDDEGRLIRFESIYWRNGQWTMPTVNIFYYNEAGQVESRIATYPNGTTDYRVIYEYNEKGLQTVLYTQYPSGGGWSNWNLRTTEYDDCGGKISSIQYSGQGPDWIPATKTIYFSNFHPEMNPGKKIPVCHNGNTIYISVNALAAHLRHGDCIGECLTEKKAENPEEGRTRVIREPPFTVFPNPAKEMITVRFDQGTDNEPQRMELTDSFGKVLRVYNTPGISDFTIYREKLAPGNYYLKLIGEETTSLIVIFR